MAWDFSTDPEYQRKLDWARDFVRTQKDRPLAGVRVVRTRPLRNFGANWGLHVSAVESGAIGVSPWQPDVSEVEAAGQLSGGNGGAERVRPALRSWS